MSKLTAPLLLVALLFAAGTVHADNWPNWRGPTSNQVASEGDYPTTLDPAANTAWQITLPGKGSSTPCVWGEHIFVTCDLDGEDGIVAYNLQGEEQWRQTLGKQRPAKSNKHKNGSGSNPSPITNGEHVFVYYRSGTVAAVDFKGEIAWTINLQDKFAENTLFWDLGTSPILAGDNIVVAVIHTGESYLIALNQKTGKIAWRTTRIFKNAFESDQAYTTPTLAEIDGQQQIVTWGADHLTGHNLEGELVWSCGGFNPENQAMWRVIASHAVSNGHAIVPYGRGDFIAFVKLGGKGDITDTARVSEDIVKRGIGSDVPTPIAVDGKAYLLTDKGKFTCYDITTGEEVWDKPFALPRGAPKYYSSPIKAGKHFYFAREDGMIFVAKEVEGGGLELVSENEMPDRQIAGIVAVNDHILIRGEKTLTAYK